MTSENNLPRYDIRQSYDWNYTNAPQDPPQVDVPDLPGQWHFCGLKVGSPLGVPAGPLLNGRWILYYAALGFDVLTYKTVRSSPRACYPLPNLQPVGCDQISGDESDLPAIDQMQGTWAVSFGMPSQSPDHWRADIEWTKNRLPKGKVLSVSVVATVEEDWTIGQMAEDYAQCARWAVESGADCIETNFSCPNVSSRDGQLFQQPQAAGLVAETVRNAIGQIPYVIKIGHVETDSAGEQLLAAVALHADALAMTNSVATAVADPRGKLLFDGQKRGICGDAIRSASLAQTRMLARLTREGGHDVRLVGVGGASTAEHVREYFASGAESVHLATAAMVDPAVALAIRADLAT